jgi:hypothetical protein
MADLGSVGSAKKTRAVTSEADALQIPALTSGLILRLSSPLTNFQADAYVCTIRHDEVPRPVSAERPEPAEHSRTTRNGHQPPVRSNH